MSSAISVIFWYMPNLDLCATACGMDASVEFPRCGRADGFKRGLALPGVGECLYSKISSHIELMSFVNTSYVP